MNPAVATALIAAASAGWVAVLGLAGGLWKTRWSQRAGLEAACDQRLWEKRSTLYEELFALLAGRAAASGQSHNESPGEEQDSTVQMPEMPDQPRAELTTLEARARECASHNVQHALMLLAVVRERADNEAKKVLAGGAAADSVQAWAEAARQTAETWQMKVAEALLILENFMRSELQHGLPPRRGWVTRRLRRKRCEWPCPASADPFPPLRVRATAKDSR